MAWRAATFGAVLALFAAQGAAAAPGLLVGAREDALKWRTAGTVAVARDLGLRALGITLGWQPGQTDLAPGDAAALNTAVVGAGGIRVVVAVFGADGLSPTTDTLRSQYCSYVGSLITRFPQINDVVIWNEPNLSGFWRPQYRNGVSEAPARYTELLAQCYDLLHGLRGSVNVIAPATSLWGNDNPNAISNISHSPTAFIRAMGAAYRQLGRTRPLFDTLGHHPYPARSDERPWSTHPEESVVSIGDLPRLVAVVDEAFDGTAQPQPDTGLPIWYLETGYQTQVDPEKAALYTGGESWPGALPDVAANPGPPAKPPDSTPAPDQATQLADSLRLTYCQPYVTAVFNFLLRDEADLAGWQSGLLWADGSSKDSYVPFRNVVQEINAGAVDCRGLATAAAGVGTVAATPRAARSLTKVTFRGRKQVPYGFLTLGAQLTRGLERTTAGLAAKQLLFVVGRTAYVTATTGAGVARLTPLPPINPGRYRVRISFAGDTLNLGSGIRVDVRVQNSRGRVESRAPLRLGEQRSARLAVRSTGKKVRGTLTLVDRGRLRTVRVLSLGLREDGRAAWLRGIGGSDRYVLNLERLRGKRLVRVRLWKNGVPVGGPATVPAKALLLARR